MLSGKKIGVVIPAYNEEKYILEVLNSIPNYIDKVIIIDDGSSDDTFKIASKFIKDKKDNRWILLKNNKNYGVGASIIKGYKICLSEGLDIAVVMAGDGQMSPEDLPSLLEPLIKGEVDYVKGDRISHPNAKKLIPFWRYLGILFFSFFTRLITGYKNLKDSQCGYTAINLKILKKLEIEKIYPSYGYPNDILIRLSMIGAKIKEVIVKPIYRGEASGITLKVAIFNIPLVIIRGAIYKLIYKIKRGLQNGRNRLPKVYRTKTEKGESFH